MASAPAVSCLGWVRYEVAGQSRNLVIVENDGHCCTTCPFITNLTAQSPDPTTSAMTFHFVISFKFEPRLCSIYRNKLIKHILSIYKYNIIFFGFLILKCFTLVSYFLKYTTYNSSKYLQQKLYVTYLKKLGVKITHFKIREIKNKFYHILRD